MKSITLESFAKVNRSLRVLGKRADGYHEIDTIFQTVDLSDRMDFLEGEEDSGEVSLTIEGLSLPVTEENLILRAARALVNRTGSRRGARIHLSKKIPVGGGLGGGSSNAAATLLGLSALWNLPLSEEDSHDLAAGLGSDVAFFLVGGRGRGTSRGEVVEPLPDGPTEYVLLAFPPFSLSTAEVYACVTPPALTGSPSATKVSGSGAGSGPDRNDLEPAAESLRVELCRLREALSDFGAASARLSGSGSTVFGLFGDEESARRAFTGLAGLREEMKTTMTIVRTVSRQEFARRAFPSAGAQRV